MPLLIGGAVISSMVAIPSYAHTVVVKTIPGPDQVVRALDPTQNTVNPTGPGAACSDFGWGGASGAFDHPCAAWIQFDQPLDQEASSLELFGPDGNTAVAGGVYFRDSTATTTSRSQVATMIPGADTMIFFPDAPLAAGRYVARSTVTESAELGGHGPQCDPNVGPTINCVEWSFLVAPTAAAPTISFPADASTIGTRLVSVTGTAEPGATVEILDPADEVLGEGFTNGDGEFSIDIAAAAGANTIKARATSALTTTSERAWAAWAACAGGALQTGEDEDLDEIILEEECGPAPAEVLPAVLDTGDVTFHTDVLNDTEAPHLEMHTAPNTIQFLEPAVIVGNATDNDEVALNVTVTSPVLGDVTSDVVMTYDAAAITEWEIDLGALLPGLYTVSITAEDPSGNVSDLIETFYVVTTGNLV